MENENAPHPSEQYAKWKAPEIGSEAPVPKDEQYLQRHLEPEQSLIEKIKTRLVLRKLSKAAGGEILQDNADHIEFKIKDFEFQATLAPVSARTLSPNIKESLLEEYDDSGKRRRELPDIKSDLSNLTEVTKLVLRNPRTGAEVKLSTILPEGHTVLIKNGGVREDFADVREQYVLVTTDLRNVSGILALFHEIGHCLDYQRKSELEKQLWSTTIGARSRKTSEVNAALAQEIRKERDAWAYAFRFLRPLIAKENGRWFQKDDVLREAHSCLGTYSKGVRKTQRDLPRRQQQYRQSRQILKDVLGEELASEE